MMREDEMRDILMPVLEEGTEPRMPGDAGYTADILKGQLNSLEERIEGEKIIVKALKHAIEELEELDSSDRAFLANISPKS